MLLFLNRLTIKSTYPIDNHTEEGTMASHIFCYNHNF